MKCEYFRTEGIYIVQLDLEISTSTLCPQNPHFSTFAAFFARHSLKLVFPLGFKNNS